MKKMDRIISQIREEEREFWGGHIIKLFAFKEKRESINMLKAMIDFGVNYRYSPEDLSAWDGELLIIDSEADMGIPSIERECVRRLYPGAESVTFLDFPHLALLSQREEYLKIYKCFFFPGQLPEN